VHDVLDAGGKVIVVFEYVEGETLSARLSQDPFQVCNEERKPLAAGLKGRFKYTVSAYGVVEDPEVEMPEGN